MAFPYTILRDTQPATHKFIGIGVMSIAGKNDTVSHSLVSTRALSISVDSGRFTGEMTFTLLYHITDNAENIISDWCSSVFSSAFTSIQDSKKRITLSFYNTEGCLLMRQEVHGCLIESFRDKSFDYGLREKQVITIPDNIPTIFSRKVLVEKTNKKISDKTFCGMEFQVRFDYFETSVA